MPNIPFQWFCFVVFSTERILFSNDIWYRRLAGVALFNWIELVGIIPGFHCTLLLCVYVKKINQLDQYPNNCEGIIKSSPSKDKPENQIVIIIFNTRTLDSDPPLYLGLHGIHLFLNYDLL